MSTDPDIAAPRPLSISKQAAIVVMALLTGFVAVGIHLSLRPPAVREPLTLDPASGWRETAWPLSPDPWWPSKAFVCGSAACGGAHTLYLRVKVGFCNCAEGIADDAELDRIGDFLPISRRHTPLTEGRPVEVIGLKGRTRPYKLVLVGTPARETDSVVIGLNSGCDAVVATAVPANRGSGNVATLEQAMAAFLAEASVAQWVRRSLGK